MRAYWILSLFSVLMSVGLLMVIMGQHREMDMITQKSDALKKISDKVYNKLQYEDNFKDSLQKLMTQGQTVVKDLETELANLGPMLEQKKKDTDTCQAEMKTIKEELDSKELANSKTTDALKAEADTWEKEIDFLKEKLTERPEICNYVAADKQSKKLCGDIPKMAPIPEETEQNVTKALTP